MCNYNVSFDELKKILNAVQRINNPEAVAQVMLGVQEVGDNIACAIMVQGGTEEVAVKFLAKKPSDYKSPSKGYVSNAALSAVLASLSMLKESVTLAVADTLKLGVKGKAMTSLPLIGDEDVPERIKMDKDSQVTRMYLKQPEFISLLKGGGFATANNDAAGRGVTNATLVVEDKGLILYSCNETGSVLGVATCPAEIQDIEVDGSTKRAKWCQEKGIENLIVPLPKKVIMNMLSMLDGEGKCSVIITDKLILLAPNDVTQYYAVVGAKAFTGGLNLIETISQIPNKGVAVVDNEKFKTNLTMIQNFASLSKEKNSPIEVKFGKKQIMLSNITSDGKVVIDLVNSTFENGEERYLDGEKLSTIIGILSKGNVRIEVKDSDNSPLIFTNGDNEKTTGAVKALIAPVNKPGEEAEDAEATEEGTTSEEANETSAE